MTSEWSVYLLVHRGTGRTYIGSTTDPARRLRQHNREILGGARSTARGAPHWMLLLYVSGFTGRSEACRWEKLVKMRALGKSQRMGALIGLSLGRCPPHKRYRKTYPVPSNLALRMPENDNQKIEE